MQMTNHLFWMVHIINICIRRYSRLLFKLFWFENKQFQNKNHTDWLKNILKVGIKTVFIKSTNGQNFTISSLLPCIGKKNLLQVERVVIAIFKIFFFFAAPEWKLWESSTVHDCLWVMVLRWSLRRIDLLFNLWFYQKQIRSYYETRIFVDTMLTINKQK